jgi:hypothetical protein
MSRMLARITPAVRVKVRTMRAAGFNYAGIMRDTGLTRAEIRAVLFPASLEAKRIKNLKWRQRLHAQTARPA